MSEIKMTRKERREKAKEIAAKYREKHRLREMGLDPSDEDGVPGEVSEAARQNEVEECKQVIFAEIGEGTSPIDVVAILRELDEEHRAEVEKLAAEDARRFAAQEAAAKAEAEKMAAAQAAAKAEAERRRIAEETKARNEALRRASEEKEKQQAEARAEADRRRAEAERAKVAADGLSVMNYRRDDGTSASEGAAEEVTEEVLQDLIDQAAEEMSEEAVEVTENAVGEDTDLGAEEGAEGATAAVIGEAASAVIGDAAENTENTEADIPLNTGAEGAVDSETAGSEVAESESAGSEAAESETNGSEVTGSEKAGSVNSGSTDDLTEEEKPKKKGIFGKLLFIAAILAVVVGCAYVSNDQIRSKVDSLLEGSAQVQTEASSAEPVTVVDAETEKATEEETEGETIPAEIQEILAQVDRLAATYDYDAALELLNTMGSQEAQSEGENPIKAKIAEIEEIKSKLVKINHEDITHIFYHSLVVEPEKTYQQTDSLIDSYKLWMTTVDEFNKITQTMYDRGYVLISIYDIIEETVDDDGDVHFTEKDLYLPEGKKAFILSLDDLSYYHCYDGRHMASKMVIDDEGKPTCEYIKDDGTTVVGDYDCVPLLDKFMEEHPDGCYRGARGTIALTGYNGILGYRTDIAYKTGKHLDDDQARWLRKHPDFDWDEECAEAKKVAECLKADGWTFASHTWGHRNVGNISYDGLVTDTEKWDAYVKPLIGDTDIIIFAHGTDLSEDGANGYSESDKYYLLKSYGFHIFCDVDSNKYRYDIRDTFVHSGRRNLDGYRIFTDAYTDADRTSDLFDAAEVVDPAREDMPEPD